MYEANAQLFPNIRANIQARREARNQTPVYSSQGTMMAADPQVISVGRLSGTVVEGDISNPYQIPAAAAGFDQRIRIVNPYTGEFYNRYYSDGQNMGVANWSGGPQMREQAYADYDQTLRRRRWLADDTNRSSGSSAMPSSRSGSSSNTQRLLNQYNSIQANSNAQIDAIRSRMNANAQQSMNDTNNLGAQLRGSRGGNGSSSDAYLKFNENAPGKKR